jgi:thioredoxin reductase (NADPH)
METFDVLIVGGGPTGLACAIECLRRDLSYVVLEKGCLVQSLVNYPVNMLFFTTVELLEIGDVPMTAGRDKPTRFETLKYYRRVAQHYGLRVRQYEVAQRMEGADGNFTVRSRTRTGQDRCYRARKLVLAAGNYGQPNLLGIPGEQLEKVSHYYREAHPYYDSDVAVIGGKNSAAEAALELYRHGARVTLIHRGPAVSEKVKYWVKPDLENRIKNGEIRALFNTSVREIQPEYILLQSGLQSGVQSGAQSGNGSDRLRNDFVLAMTGYHPDVALLAHVGVTLDPISGRPDCDPETYQTNVAGIYLAGVLVAGMQSAEIFIENGRFHGRQIAAHISQLLGSQLLKQRA